MLADHDPTTLPEEIQDAMNKVLDQIGISSLCEDRSISALEDALANDEVLEQLVIRYVSLREGDPTIMRKIAYLEVQERARLVKVRDLQEQLGDLYGTGIETSEESWSSNGHEVRATINVAFAFNFTALAFVDNVTSTQEM